jgi:hypothetical protein
MSTTVPLEVISATTWFPDAVSCRAIAAAIEDVGAAPEFANGDVVFVGVHEFDGFLS